MEGTGLLWTAAWLGIMTSVSPCPLASNLAACSFLAARAPGRGGWATVISGAAYGLGRASAYTAIGAIIAWNLASLPMVSEFLSEQMNQLLGPLLLLVGLVILGVVRLPVPGFTASSLAQRLGERGDWAAAYGLGAVLALSFCPISAALFFGSLIPLAVKSGRTVLLPLIYGLGTALPVAGAAVALGLGLDFTGRWFKAAQAMEAWARRATGAVFVGVGAYYAWNYLVPWGH